MFTELELQKVAKFAEKIATSWNNPAQMNYGYNLGMPELKAWTPPKPTFGDAMGQMWSGLGKQVGTTAQTLLTGREAPGVAENFLNHGFQLALHPTDPKRFRDLVSLKNITEPFQRAMPGYREAWHETGAPAGFVAPELGARFGILRNILLNGPKGAF